MVRYDTIIHIGEIMVNEQVKSKSRVSDHGEVFTAEREVNAMLDLVKDETMRIDSRFLEPACGTGNFLIKVLERKLNVVKKRYKKSQLEYERYAFVAISNIYGVELLEDNVDECRERLYDYFLKEYKKNYKDKVDTEYLDSIKYVLFKNILHGDALTLLRNDGQPIIFSEWSLLDNEKVKRRDFRFDELLSVKEEQMNIFMIGWEYDEEIKSYIPSPIKEYPLSKMRRLQYD